LVKYSVLPLLLFCSFLLNAQWDLRKFRHFTVEDGLPSMEVYDVLQDSAGYIWLASNTGLARYDGYHFIQYTTKDGLPNNDVIEIDYVNNILWLSSLGSLTIHRNDSLIQIPVKAKDNTGHIEYKVVHTPEGNYWISIFGNLFYLDSELNTLPFSDDIRADHMRFWCFPGPDNNTWLYRSKENKQDLVVLKEDSIINRIELPFSCGIARFFSPAFSDGYLFFHCGHNLLRYHLQDQTVDLLFSGLPLSSDILVWENRLWVTYPKEGVVAYNIHQNGELSEYARFLTDQFPSGIHFDRENNLWISTLGNGLFMLPTQAEKISVFNTSSDLSDQALESIYLDDSGFILGNREGEIVQYNKDGQLLKKYMLDRPTAFSTITCRITGILKLNEQVLLLASDKGLFLINGERKTRVSTDVIKDLKRCPGGLITMSSNIASYVASISTLLNVSNRNEEESTPSVFRKIYNGRAYCSFVDSAGKTWIGTSTDGLVMIEGRDTTMMGKYFAPLYTQAKDIIELDKQVLAIATHGEGVILIKGDQFLQIDEQSRLASNFCSALKVQDSTIWVGTDEGLSKLTLSDFDTGNYTISNFRKSDGLITNDIKDLAIKNGKVYMATHLGLIYFEEKDLIANSTLPDIKITKILINEKEVPLADAYELESHENDLTISYVGLSYRNINNLVYAYLLKGVDTEWKHSKILETHYRNLSPGTYYFEVKAIDDHGIENELPAPIEFTIQPHFTQTYFFYILIYALAFLLLAIGFYIWTASNRNRWLQSEVSLKTKELESKVQDLANTNYKLERSNAELKQFAHVASHDLKSPLRSIAGFVQLLERKAGQKLNEEEKEYIHYVVNSTKNMGKLIDDLLNYSQVSQNSHQKESIKLQEVIQEVIQRLESEIQKHQASINILNSMPEVEMSTLNALRLFQNLLSNAIKFNKTAAPQVNISCQPENGYWRFAIEDNGIGIEPSYQKKIFQIFQRLHTIDQYPGTGVGLAICKKIVEENGGTIWFESNEMSGTTFYFTLPKKQSQSE